MRNIILKRKGECAWVTYIKKRIDNNLNLLCILTGPTGSGKTWTAMKKSCELDPEFDPELQLTFDFRGLLRIINNFNDKEHPLYKRKYKVAVYDEPQTGISNRDWQSKANKLFNLLLSTFRHQNIILFFCTPYSDFVDSASMKLIHSEWKVKGWNAKTKKCTVRPVLLQYNSRKRDFYQHSLYVINGTVNKFINMKVGICPKHITVPYEKMKIYFTKTLNTKITRELEEYENKLDGPKDNISKGRKALTDRQLEIMKLIAELGTVNAVAQRLSINKGSVSKSKTLSERKGYRISEFRKSPQSEK